MSQSALAGLTATPELRRQQEIYGGTAAGLKSRLKDSEYFVRKDECALQVITKYDPAMEPAPFAGAVRNDLAAAKEVMQALKEKTKQKATDRKSGVLKDPLTPEEAERDSQSLQRAQDVVRGLSELDERLTKTPLRPELLSYVIARHAEGLRELTVPALREELEDYEQKKQAADEAMQGFETVLRDGEADAVAAKRKVERMLRLFEADRTPAPPRNTEKDLQEMRKALKSFADRTLGPVLPCVQRAVDKLTQFADQLEREVDQIAHRAQCAKCQKLNGIARPDEAKAMVRNLVDRLERLGDANPLTLGGQDAADFDLAKALKAARQEVDETGQTAGKMIGVLICLHPRTGGRVVIQAYSGTVASRWRMANAEVVRLQAIWDKHAQALSNIPDLKMAREDALKIVAVEALKVSELERLAALSSPTPVPDPSGPLPDQSQPPKARRGPPSEAEKNLSAGRKVLFAAKADVTKIEKTIEVQGANVLLPDALAALNREIARTERLRDDASADDAAVESATALNWAPSIPETGTDAVLRSAAGDQVSLVQLNHGYVGTPHGVCAAPKMVQAAYRRGLIPIAMAEAWFGGGGNVHGELVASCETCMKNIGFQLCDNPHGTI